MSNPCRHLSHCGEAIGALHLAIVIMLELLAGFFQVIHHLIEAMGQLADLVIKARRDAHPEITALHAGHLACKVLQRLFDKSHQHPADSGGENHDHAEGREKEQAGGFTKLTVRFSQGHVEIENAEHLLAGAVAAEAIGLVVNQGNNPDHFLVAKGEDPLMPPFGEQRIIPGIDQLPQLRRVGRLEHHARRMKNADVDQIGAVADGLQHGLYLLSVTEAHGVEDGPLNRRYQDLGVFTRHLIEVLTLALEMKGPEAGNPHHHEHHAENDHLGDHTDIGGLQRQNDSSPNRRTTSNFHKNIGRSVTDLSARLALEHSLCSFHQLRRGQAVVKEQLFGRSRLAENVPQADPFHRHRESLGQGFTNGAAQPTDHGVLFCGDQCAGLPGGS